VGIQGADGLEGIAFWVFLTLGATMFPVLQPRGAVVSVGFAPVLAATFLAGPTVGALVAFLGSTDLRELRREVPWYGTLYNHCSAALSAALAGLVYVGITGGVLLSRDVEDEAALLSLAAAIAAGLVYFMVSAVTAGAAISVRLHQRFANVMRSQFKEFGLTLIGLVPLSWVMALAFVQVHYVVALIFAIPLYTTRAAYQSVVEIRKMFTQTIKALAEAIDARDPSTKKHSENVSTIAMEIGEQMGVSEADLESLQWGGLLHDVGKIGIPDAVLLKPSRLNKEERMAMNAHPEKGRDILQDVEALAPILPVILHHHQWYNGSGYPKVKVGDTERALIGEEIPLLARILHVADAFEAMTAVRPYRPNPMGPQQAIEELRKYAGIQFDPRVVEAFAKTATAQGEWPKPEPEPVVPGAPIPMLGQVAKLRSAGTTTSATAEPS
jgi:putative nucleotidyltransferase with HDIG domain